MYAIGQWLRKKIIKNSRKPSIIAIFSCTSAIIPEQQVRCPFSQSCGSCGVLMIWACTCFWVKMEQVYMFLVIAHLDWAARPNESRNVWGAGIDCRYLIFVLISQWAPLAPAVVAAAAFLHWRACWDRALNDLQLHNLGRQTIMRFWQMDGIYRYVGDIFCFYGVIDGVNRSHILIFSGQSSYDVIMLYRKHLRKYFL